MEETLRGQAVAAIKTLGKRGRTSRIPRPVRETVLAYATAARRERMPWQTIADELGLSATVMQRWLRTSVPTTTRRRGSLLPVLVRERCVAPTTTCTVVTPSGLRIEVLELAQAAALVRLLS